MYYVYILYSAKSQRLYVGQTNNLKIRLRQHNKGKVTSTKRDFPLVLIYKERYDSRSEAMERERFLKSLYSANFKKKILKEFLSTALDDKDRRAPDCF